MKLALPGLLIVFLLSGCTAIRNANSPPGEMDENGKINPCHNHRKNRQACGDAKFNVQRVPLLQLGDSIVTAKQKMQAEPARRSVKSVDGRVIETWMYLVDYDKSIYTVVTFSDGVISLIESTRA